MKIIKKLSINYGLLIFILIQAPLQFFCASDATSTKSSYNHDPIIKNTSIESKKHSSISQTDLKASAGAGAGAGAGAEAAFDPTEEFYKATLTESTDDDWTLVASRKTKTYKLRALAFLQEKRPECVCSGRDVNHKCFETLKEISKSKEFNELMTENGIDLLIDPKSYHMTISQFSIAISTQSDLSLDDIKEEIENKLNKSIFDAIIAKCRQGIELTSNTLLLFNKKYIVAAFYDLQNPARVRSLLNGLLTQIQENFSKNIQGILPKDSRVTITKLHSDFNPHITLAKTESQASKKYEQDQVILEFSPDCKFTISPTNYIKISIYDN